MSFEKVFNGIVDWNEGNPIKAATCFIVAVFLCIFGVWVFGSKMESAAFNRITGSDVTTWEAMWVKLRVDRPIERGER